jgi:hypothetical protein
MKIFLVLPLLVVAVGCSDACANALVDRADAPDGKHTAFLFQRDCGATSGFSTQVSILRPDEQLSGGGNIFRADDDHGAAQAAQWGGPWAEMRWLSTTRLLIRYADRSRIFEQNDSVSRVEVSYQAVTH